jgi:hypothetical protein
MDSDGTRCDGCVRPCPNGVYAMGKEVGVLRGLVEVRRFLCDVAPVPERDAGVHSDLHSGVRGDGMVSLLEEGDCPPLIPALLSLGRAERRLDGCSSLVCAQIEAEHRPGARGGGILCEATSLAQLRHGVLTEFSGFAQSEAMWG